MVLAASIFGVAFAAFCVWLTVRIVNRRERWAKRTLAAIVLLPVLYVASIGPACWITSRTKIGTELIPVVYRPITLGCVGKPRYPIPKIANVVGWYANLAAAPRGYWGFCIHFVSPDPDPRPPVGIRLTWGWLPAVEFASRD